MIFAASASSLYPTLLAARQETAGQASALAAGRSPIQRLLTWVTTAFRSVGSSWPLRLPIVLVMKISLIAFLVGCSVAAHAAACPDDPSWKARLLEQLNSMRASGGACAGEGSFLPGAPVRWNPALETVAAVQAAWMAERGELLHVGRSGESIGERARQADYVYERVGENVAMGFFRLEQVMEAWRASAKHCSNLLDPRYTEVALACVRAPNGPWWSIALGRPNSNTRQAATSRVSWRLQ